MKRLLAWALMLTGVMTAQVLAADVKLKALFIAQAAYNEQSVRDMTDEFQKQNPGISVELEFVPYEGLHDKIVLGQGSGDGYDAVLFDVIWPAEFATNNILVDVTDRITPEMKKESFLVPGPRWTTKSAVTACRGCSTRSTCFTTRKCWPKQALMLPQDVDRAHEPSQSHEGEGNSPAPDRLELGSGGSGDLRLWHHTFSLWRQISR